MMDTDQGHLSLEMEGWKAVETEEGEPSLGGTGAVVRVIAATIPT